MIFDATVTSNGPRTYLKRRGSKFCVEWSPENLRSSHMDPIGEKTLDPRARSGIFLIFDAKVTSNDPGTYLKKRGSKLCVEWWPDDLRSSHMYPIGGKTLYPGSGSGIFSIFDAQDASNDPGTYLKRRG